jgi:flagellar biosynthetic protein FliS
MLLKWGAKWFFFGGPVSRIPVADRHLVLPRVEDLEIVVMLFDRVVDSLQAAIGHCQAGEIEARCHALTAAAEAIGDLAEGLEPGSADEWSTRTAALYADILRRIAIASTRNGADQIGNALRLVTPVYLSWRTLLARAEQSRLTEELAPRVAVA